MFDVVETYKGKNTFNIYNYKLKHEDLELNVSKMLFSKKILNYIFTGIENEDVYDYISMLRKFIPEKFFYKEKYFLDNWKLSKSLIKELIDANYAFYSFYAEALMMYLNYELLDNKLICASLNINESLTDQRTGADACMYSEKNIVLGEAKFYKNFKKALNQIISDFSNKSLLNKINGLFRCANNNIIVVKTLLDEEAKNITYEEFFKHRIILSGFILHNKYLRNRYEYNSIDSINPISELKNYDIIFYHLPINSKEELVYLIIKNALEVIVDESTKQG